MLEIELNGARYELNAELNAKLNAAPAAGATLHDLVGSLGLAGQALALAVNRSVVPRERWADTPLQAGDKVDVVRAIGGG